MADLLDLDYSAIDTFTLHGIDLDPEALLHAKNHAEQKRLTPHCRFLEQDAWNLDLYEEFDLVTSNGLTIYEPDDHRVTTFYQKIYNTLKIKGVFITSFLTSPLTWRFDRINPEHALLQKIVLVDILGVKWHILREEELVRKQLEIAGFTKTTILYDQAHIFPTLIAEKAEK
jgi:SAM-dependent methyltransferase